MGDDLKYGLRPTADFVASCTCGWSLLFLHEHTAKDVARAHRQAYPGVHETSVGPLDLDQAHAAPPMHGTTVGAFEELRAALRMLGLAILSEAARAMRRRKGRP